jgi:hypothetical protein
MPMHPDNEPILIQRTPPPPPGISARQHPAVVDPPQSIATKPTRSMHAINRDARPAPRHGDRSANNSAGCRCPDAHADRLRHDHELADDTLQSETVDATGTRRRLQALAAIGWPTTHLATRLGTSQRSVQRWYHQRTVQRSIAERVAALYEALSMIPGPNLAARTRAHAAGWVPPLAWDDEVLDLPSGQPCSNLRQALPAWDVDDVAVDRACHGEQVGRQLTLAERITAVKRLATAGESAYETACRMGLSVRTVKRLRHHHDVSNPGGMTERKTS